MLNTVYFAPLYLDVCNGVVQGVYYNEHLSYFIWTVILKPFCRNGVRVTY